MHHIKRHLPKSFSSGQNTCETYRSAFGLHGCHGCNIVLSPSSSISNKKCGQVETRVQSKLLQTAKYPYFEPPKPSKQPKLLGSFGRSLTAKNHQTSSPAPRCPSKRRPENRLVVFVVFPSFHGIGERNSENLTHPLQYMFFPAYGFFSSIQVILKKIVLAFACNAAEGL